MCRTLAFFSVVVGLLGVSIPALGQTTRPTDRTVAPAASNFLKSSEGPAVAVTTPAATAETPAVATEPTAPAVDMSWPRQVEALAKTIVDGDRAALEAMLTSRSAIRRFGTSQAEESSRIMERLAKSVLVGQHGYLHPPLVMAADIAADFKRSTVVPDKSKSRYLIDDDSEMKRANATAVQWVVEQLGATQGTPVGVIILWTPKPAPVAGAPIFEATFILCRGEEVGAQSFKMSNVVYGTPIGDAANP